MRSRQVVATYLIRMLNALNIAWYHPRLGHGGAQINSLELAVELQRLGHRVVFIGREGSLLDDCKRRGVEYFAYPYDDYYHPSWRGLKHLAMILRERNIDIIWTACYLQSLEARILELFGVVVHAPLYGDDVLPSWHIPVNGPIGWVIPFHADCFVRKLGWPRAWVKTIRGRMNTSMVADQIPAAGHLSNACRISREKKKVILVSRLAETKRGSVLLFIRGAAEVLKQRRDVQFTVIGDGDLYQESKRLADEISSGDEELPVVFAGHVSDVISTIKQSDVVCGMASTIIQAVLCGKPAIVLGNEGFSSLVTTERFEKLAHFHFNMNMQRVRSPELPFAASVNEALQEKSHEEALRLSEHARVIYCSRLGAAQLAELFSAAIMRRLSMRRSEFALDGWQVLRALVSLFVYRARRKMRSKINHRKNQYGR